MSGGRYARDPKRTALADPQRYRKTLYRPEMYRKVVVPLDESEQAQGVLPHVAEVIRGRESRVYLLSVVSSLKGAAPAGTDAHSAIHSAQEERQRLEKEWSAYLQAAARQLEHVDADVQVGVRFGRPADQILAFADKVGADLVAISAHSRPGLSRWVSGNVADRVMHGARCPTLLVRAGHPSRRIAYQRIVVPLDGSERAEQVLPYVRALIRPQHTRVFLIRVLRTGWRDRAMALLTSYPPGLQLTATVLDHAEVQLQSYLRSVAAALREQGAVVHAAVRRGSPPAEILAYADEVGADLIGMTTQGLSGSSPWVYGTVAGRVVQRARSPVLLVRPTLE